MKWQPAPVFLPGKFYRQKSQAACSPCGARVGHQLATKPPQDREGKKKGKFFGVVGLGSKGPD